MKKKLEIWKKNMRLKLFQISIDLKKLLKMNRGTHLGHLQLLSPICKSNGQILINQVLYFIGSKWEKVSKSKTKREKTKLNKFPVTFIPFVPVTVLGSGAKTICELRFENFMLTKIHLDCFSSCFYFLLEIKTFKHFLKYSLDVLKIVLLGAGSLLGYHELLAPLNHQFFFQYGIFVWWQGMDGSLFSLKSLRKIRQWKSRPSCA